MNRKLILVLPMLVAGMVAGLVVTRSAFSLDPRAKSCGADTWSVLGTFEVAQANQVRAHIPRMGAAPELDISSAPAYVVLFRGPIELPTSHFVKPAMPPSYSGVICVFVNSVPEYYTDVDTTGWSE